MIVYKTFATETELMEWLYDEKNIEELHKKYPPAKYIVDANLTKFRIEVMKKSTIKK